MTNEGLEDRQLPESTEYTQLDTKGCEETTASAVHC